MYKPPQDVGDMYGRDINSDFNPIVPPSTAAQQQQRAQQKTIHDNHSYHDRMNVYRPPGISVSDSLQQQQESHSAGTEQNQSAFATPTPGISRNIRPSMLDIQATQFVAPDVRAARMAGIQGTNIMNAFNGYGNGDGDSTNPSNYNLEAPENLGEEPRANRNRGGTKKRRNTRRRSHKYKPKRKQQTRKKTFRRRK